jgi:hypothetical protein
VLRLGCILLAGAGAIIRPVAIIAAATVAAAITTAIAVLAARGIVVLLVIIIIVVVGGEGIAEHRRRMHRRGRGMLLMLGSLLMRGRLLMLGSRLMLGCRWTLGGMSAARAMIVMRLGNSRAGRNQKSRKRGGNQQSRHLLFLTAPKFVPER